MKLFDDGDVEDISKIEINQEFAKRYEHNKKREDLQRFEEMKKKGLIDDSGSDSESESDDGDDDINASRKEVKFFDALLKVRKKDPVLMEKDGTLFESSDEEGKEEREGKKGGKGRPKYLKDVTAQHLMEGGAEYEEEEEDEDEKESGEKIKTYAEEQEEFRKSVLKAMEEAEREKDNEVGELLRQKEGEEEEEDEDDEEVKKRLDEYFGEDEKLDENDMFLKDFFKNKLWIDKEKGKKPIDDLEELSNDEEAIEAQEDYERDYNFRFEENASDRILGHSRVVEGSVRKETNTRKKQRERKKERMEQAEAERQEEVKRLKNLKKKEIQEKLGKVRKIAGVGMDAIALTEEDLEEDFDPEEFDKKMGAAFGNEYYEAEDADPEFGSDVGEDGSDLEKPDFEKEDELLGLPKDWEIGNSNDGVISERENKLEGEVDHEVDEEGAEVDNDQLQLGEGKKKKWKLTLKEKVAVDKELEELYKLDYEDVIGDMKTRFKYRPVAPRKYGLNAETILMMDEKDLNQYVSLKKLAPYREKEWKVPPLQRYNFMKTKGPLLHGLQNGQTSSKRKKRTDGSRFGETAKETVNARDEQPSNDGSKLSRRAKRDFGETSKEAESRSQKDVKAQGEQPSNDESKLSRRAKRRRLQKEKKLPQSRLIAYGKIPSSSKSKFKS